MTEVTLPIARFTQDDFRVGRVISKAGSTFLRNFPRFVLVTGIASLLSALIDAVVAAYAPGNPAANFLGLSLAVILVIASQAFIIPGAIAALPGGRAGLAASCRHGLRRVLPVIGLATCLFAAFFGLVGGVVVTVGTGFYLYHATSPTVNLVLVLVLVYVPGLMLLMTWFVAVPACVIEDLGPLRSIRRSSALTKGRRWRMFALTLLIFIPAALVLGVIGGLTGAAVLTPTAARTLPVIWQAIWSAFFATLVAAAYHELRIAKEGADVERLPAVFD